MSRFLRSCWLKLKIDGFPLMAILFVAGMLASPCWAYTNPIRNVDGPDPGVLYDAGTFWMVHTAANVPAWPLRSSTSLVSGWSGATNKITTTNQPAWLTGPYWAPEIHRVQTQKASIPLFQSEDFVYMIFSTGKSSGAQCVMCASATTPNGSYTVNGTGPLVGGSVIDPHLFQDSDGRKYLYWHQATPNAILGREMNATCTGWATVSSTETMMEATKDYEGYKAPDWKGNVEAPWVIKRGNYYYMFYSGDWYTGSYYKTCVARSSSPLGPWTKKSTAILQRKAAYPNENPPPPFSGPGHGCLVKDCAGDYWYFYHAYVGLPSDENDDRVQMLDKVLWDAQGWPYFGNNGNPSTTAQANPVFTGDNAPTCTVTFPATNGTTLSGQTTLAASATDETDITEVVFYRWGPAANQIRIGNATLGYFGWVVSWNTAGLSGNVEVFAVATDTYGHRTYSTGRIVNVQN